MPSSDSNLLSPSSSAPQAIILAAGKGTRMTPTGDPAPLPKVLYPVADQPMIRWVVRACLDAGVSRLILVVGYRADLVRQALADLPNLLFVEQPQQRGTAHAVLMTRPLFDGLPPVDLFVLAGDGPLIRPQTLLKLLHTHRSTAAAATLATAVLDDPTGYGRILRHPDGSFAGIVEHKDCTPAQRLIREVNPSYYCFRSTDLFAALNHVRPDNRQGEYYLTDVPAILLRAGKTVSLIEAVPPEDVLSINTPAELARVDAILRQRLGLPPAHAAADSSRTRTHPGPHAP